MDDGERNEDEKFWTNGQNVKTARLGQNLDDWTPKLQP